MDVAGTILKNAELTALGAGKTRLDLTLPEWRELVALGQEDEHRPLPNLSADATIDNADGIAGVLERLARDRLVVPGRDSSGQRLAIAPWGSDQPPRPIDVKLRFSNRALVHILMAEDDEHNPACCKKPQPGDRIPHCSQSSYARTIARGPSSGRNLRLGSAEDFSNCFFK